MNLMHVLTELIEFFIEISYLYNKITCINQYLVFQANKDERTNFNELSKYNKSIICTWFASFIRILIFAIVPIHKVQLKQKKNELNIEEEKIGED
jgi:hypothetical protein